MVSFLFTIVVDVLSRILSRGVEDGSLKGFQVREEGVNISHLQFLDVDKFKNRLTFLQILELVSGLRNNFSKSSITGLNKDSSVSHYFFS